MAILILLSIFVVGRKKESSNYEGALWFTKAVPCSMAGRMARATFFHKCIFAGVLAVADMN